MYYKRLERIRHHLVLNLVTIALSIKSTSFVYSQTLQHATAHQNVWLQCTSGLIILIRIRPPHIPRNKTFLKLRRCLFPSAGPSHKKHPSLAVVEHLSVLFQSHPSSHRCSLEALFMALWRGGFWEFSTNWCCKRFQTSKAVALQTPS